MKNVFKGKSPRPLGAVVKRSSLTKLSGMCFLTLCFLSGSTLKADIVTYNVDFTAHTFQIGSGADPAPQDPVVGAFTITFDTDVAVTNATSGITLKSLNISLGSSLSYSYDPNAGTFPAGTLRVGGLNAGSDVIIFGPSTDDFWLYINDFNGTPTFEQLGYTQNSVSSNNLFFTLNQTGSVNVSAIPEPAAGFLTTVAPLAGLILIRRKRCNSKLIARK